MLHNKGDEFLKGRPITLIIKYSIPTIVGMLVNALYTVVDRIYVGNIPQVGEKCIAAVTVATPITVIAFSVAMLIGAGGAANISITLGRQEKQKAENYVGNGLLLSIILGVANAMLILAFLKPLLTFFGASAEVLPYAYSYTAIMIAGSVINSIGFVLNRYMIAQGFTSLSMRTNIIGVVLNIILAPIFIFVFNMGINGAAIGSVLAQLASALWVFYCFYGRKMPLRIVKEYLKPNTILLKSICVIGLPPFFMQLSISMVSLTLNNSLRIYGGDIALAAVGVTTAISQVMLMPIYGINQGTQPIVGYNYGARVYSRVKKLLQSAILLATGVMLFFWIIIMLFARQIAALFGADNAALLALTPIAIRIFMVALPFVGFQIVSSNYYQAVGRPKYAIMLTLSRQVFLLIPLVLIMPHFFGLYGIFAAGALADFLSVVLTGVFFFFEQRRLSALKDGQELI